MILPKLFLHMYDDIDFQQNNIRIAQRAVLCPKIATVKSTNDGVLELFPGVVKTYYAQDFYDADPNDNFYVLLDFLNFIETASFPPFVLKLKVSVMVMILRNIDLEMGLCNSTKLQVNKMFKSVLIVQVVYNTAAAVFTTTNNNFEHLGRPSFPI